jgi:UDP-N-acetylmuramate dehydrogenase
VGSFFTNPVVEPEVAERVLHAALAAGLITEPGALPRYPQPDGRVKLSAAWLIERSGTHKGERHGPVGVSSRHTLALVHHGGGSSAQLLALAARVSERVLETFGIALSREPVLLGFDP